MGSGNSKQASGQATQQQMQQQLQLMQQMLERQQQQEAGSTSIPTAVPVAEAAARKKSNEKIVVKPRRNSDNDDDDDGTNGAAALLMMLAHASGNEKDEDGCPNIAKARMTAKGYTFSYKRPNDEGWVLGKTRDGLANILTGGKGPGGLIKKDATYFFGDFEDGKMKTGTWYDKDGDPEIILEEKKQKISFNKGKDWLEMPRGLLGAAAAK